MAETEAAPHTNGIDTIAEEDECNKTRPADIEADMREMERRKRVESIMCSRLFREELERIVDCQMRDGGSSNILQQLSDIMGMPAARVGSVFKSSNCVVPINDIRGMEAMGYEKGEKILRCKVASAFRLLDLYGWAQGIGSLITARLNADQELFLVNPFGVLSHEITASSLNKVNMQGQVVEQGTTNFGVNASQFTLHSVIHAARPDIRCAIYVGCNAVVAISALKQGLLPLTKDSALLGELSVHTYTGALNEPEEKDKLLRSLGPVSKVLLLTNHGAICCGETVEEAFYAVNHIVAACEAQLKLLPVGLDNLIVISEETRKAIYDASRKPPEGVASNTVATDNKERTQVPKWRVGGAEFEALMRMLDNAGFRTGYIYRNPLVKNDLPKPKNDVEVPPAVSSLGYLIEEEELFKQGIWKKGDFRKGGDRSRWLNSPNVYQKVEVLETGTPDPKKITKWIDANVDEWVAEASPTHSSTPVKIDCALQFVPPNTNPKEFKRIQQQIKDYRRADKISAGPQSHILEGVSWDEANRLKDANVSATGDHVVLMGAASKGIIQRGYQHNATVYKAPYAKNPFDSVTDDELNEYKKTVEKKRQGDYTDTDFSESEALSSLQISEKTKPQPMSPPSQSEPEDTAAEHQVLRIETKQVPKPSQPEVVLSDELEGDVSDTEDVYDQFTRGLDQSKLSVHSSNLELFNMTASSASNMQNLSVSASTFLMEDGRCMPFSVRSQIGSSFYPTQSFIYLTRNDAQPHRTNAFFGFRTPSNIPMVNHFHIPILPSKYLGRSLSTSLSNVFGTERYLYMSNNSLKQTIKKKLDFEQMQLSARHNYYRDLEIDFEYLEDNDGNNNFERFSEVCDARLRNMQHENSRYGSSFLEKLSNMQYSKPSTPKSVLSTADFVGSENSLLNRTRELFSDGNSSAQLDSLDLKILEKIDNHTRMYGSLPELYHKIGEQILGRKNYEYIDMNSPKVTCATQTDVLAASELAVSNHFLNGDSLISSRSSYSPQNESCDSQPPMMTLNKTTKNRRNRNFVLENIQKVKSKQLLSHRQAREKSLLIKSAKRQLEASSTKKTPATVKPVKMVRKTRKSSLKRRSLQFTTDEEDDESSTILEQVFTSQAESIAKMGDTLDQMTTDVVKMVQMHQEIDATRQNHIEMVSMRVLTDCQRVNQSASALTEGDD